MTRGKRGGLGGATPLGAAPSSLFGLPPALLLALLAISGWCPVNSVRPVCHARLLGAPGKGTVPCCGQDEGMLPCCCGRAHACCSCCGQGRTCCGCCSGQAHACCGCCCCCTCCGHGRGISACGSKVCIEPTPYAVPGYAACGQALAAGKSADETPPPPGAANSGALAFGRSHCVVLVDGPAVALAWAAWAVLAPAWQRTWPPPRRAAPAAARRCAAACRASPPGGSGPARYAGPAAAPAPPYPAAS
eukprot:scaffold78413_cov67-Phaeocystis_antarctica.AAC.1